MRFYALVAACAILAVSAPGAASAAATWQPATATMVTAGITSRSTFEIQAYVMLPQQCYSARIRTLAITSQLHRSFIVEELPSSTPCTDMIYKCYVSTSYKLPIQQPFDVMSKGKTWKVHLSMQPPTPMKPSCKG